MQGFEDFPVETVIALGPYTVGREEVVAFAREFDPQPFHLDEDAGRASLLGGLSASGWHTCAMMMRMMCDAFLNRSTSQGSPGVDFVAWRSPVRPGDTLTGTATVLEARLSAKRPALGLVKLRNRILNGEGAAVLEAEYTLLLLTRSGAAA